MNMATAAVQGKVTITTRYEASMVLLNQRLIFQEQERRGMCHYGML